ncbi:TonB-dependent receptor [Mongoliitalea lutea]|nr:outer membrane beta-barrel protein [Mongoliitalea lutea]
MKSFPNFHKRFAFALMAFALTVSFLSNAQSTEKLTGTLLHSQTEAPVAYANVVMYQLPDSLFIAGANTNMDGFFELSYLVGKSFFLRFSYMGFESFTLSSEELQGNALGTLYFQESESLLEAVLIEGEKEKGITEGEKAVFMINKQHVGASNTGMDILNLIPGVFVDFNQNISISGKNKVLIFVNGAERDHRFVQQLRAGQIDQVEVILNPSARFAAEADAVIHILLAERESGFSGMVYGEMPISRNEVYSFPSASMSFYTPKFHAYTSYNGAFSIFDVVQTYERNTTEGTQIQMEQKTRQRSISNTIHQGLEYALSSNTLLHGYIAGSWFSETHNGSIELQSNQGDTWTAKREEEDRNRSLTTALYFQHRFHGEKESSISVDWTQSRLRGENQLRFLQEEERFINYIRPSQQVSNLRTDYSTQLNPNWRLITVFQLQLRHFANGHENDFDFRSQVRALYGSFIWKGEDWDAEFGMRVEEIQLRTLSQEGRKNHFFFLPNARLGHVWNEKHSTRFFFRSAMVYPLFHQLNNFEAFLDPFTLSFGNQDLQPYTFHQANVEHTWNTGNLLLMNAVFFEKRSQMINELYALNSEGLMEVTFGNLGDLFQTGIQSSGAMRLSKQFSINHMLRVFHSRGIGNDREQFPVRDRVAIETGFSGVLALEKDIFLTLRFRYLSPVNDIQSDFFSGPLYFLAAEKKLGDQWKLGMTSALPFSRRFTYYGLETRGKDFQQRSTGQIHMSRIPLWFTLSYSFQKGKSVQKEKKEVSSGLHINKKGF